MKLIVFSISYTAGPVFKRNESIGDWVIFPELDAGNIGLSSFGVLFLSCLNSLRIEPAPQFACIFGFAIRNSLFGLLVYFVFADTYAGPVLQGRVM